MVAGIGDGATARVEVGNESAPEDLARQAVYSFLTRVLAAPLTAAEAGHMSGFASDDTPLGKAVLALCAALADASPSALEREYHDLFIGVGRGELIPFGSVYLTGFLTEKPLADLRRDLARLGFERPADVKEPEDHIAALCDVMSHVIEGAATGEFDIYDQDQFFSAHIKPWAEKFFADLESAKTADAYRHVGRVGRIFMGIEEQGFGMIARA
jgi:TorA maturation chaperone TorD